MLTENFSQESLEQLIESMMEKNHYFFMAQISAKTRVLVIDDEDTDFLKQFYLLHCRHGQTV